MNEATKEALSRALTFIDIAQALVNIEAPALRAEIMSQLQAAQAPPVPAPAPPNGPTTGVPIS